MKKRRSEFFSVFFTFALDSLSATIIFPIFVPLFLDPRQGFFLFEISTFWRNFLLGAFLSAFPLAQFFFAPFLGSYADCIGRKKVLFCSILTTAIGYFLCAVGIHFHSLASLFVGRIITGVGAGNFTVCLAILADLTANEKKRAQYFSLGSMLGGLAFVLGPFLGGKLSDNTISSYFSPSFPMLIGSVLSLINSICIFAFFKETLEIKKQPVFFFTVFKTLKFAFTNKNIANLYFILFIYFISWNLLYQFIPVFILKSYNITNSSIGNIISLMGVFWIIGSGVFFHFERRFFSIRNILIFSFVPFAILSSLTAVPHQLWANVVIFGFAVLFASIIWPACMSEISKLTDQSMQGKVLGLTQSIQSLAMLIAPLLGGVFLIINPFITFFLSSFLSIVCIIFSLKIVIK